ncbi:hypothetical protein BCF74_11213 [Knoellia remsis]|uniref:Uncharacterized protein n=1 Tax=Knoellia remsis TaxID=407159 RepID=A0A2T0UJZ0_9MICO|nr:hypothetical protein [Knoellia remsis]PRY58196.1 hypothetical protein BCF74_11213 [Knoellia remsis]
MRTTITLPIADHLVEFMDQEISAGRAESRDDLVERAVSAELQRRRGDNPGIATPEENPVQDAD